jgi:acyl-CoA thioester hydrolase
MTFELAIFRKDESELLATGEIVWVNTDQTTHRPVPIPAATRELLGRDISLTA